MRAKHFCLLAFSGLALLAAAPGCGDGNSSSGSGGSGASGSSTGSTGSETSSSSTGTGTPPDTNVDCDSGEPLGTMLVDGATLEPVDTDEDFYTFEGDAGTFIQIFTDAKPEADEFDSTYPDLVVTLFEEVNGNWVQIARNDDPTPRYSNDSELYTILPDTGKYCVRVSECAKVFGAEYCSSTVDITNYGYQIAGGTFDAAQINGIVEEKEPNDAPANATAMEYEKANATSYYVTLGYGGFSGTTDVDIYSFTVPADVKVPFGRATCNFDFFPYGVDGNGSTADNAALAYITTAADPSTKIAEVDFTLADPKTSELPSIGVPCTFGQSYLLFFERGAGAMKGKNDFTIFTHSGGGSNPMELETEADPNTNDKLGGAEVLETQDNMDGSYSFFIDGDLIGAPGDIDTFEINAAAGPNLKTLSVACGAQRFGSGLRDFRATMLDENENVIGMGISTESAGTGIYIEQLAIPQGATKVYLQLESSGQDPNVTSTFYRCGIYLDPGTP